MKLPLILLAICSIFIGYLFSESMNGIGTLFYGNSVYHNVYNYDVYEAEFSLFFIKYVPLIFTIFGMVSFFFNNNNSLFFSFLFDKSYVIVYRFFSKALYYDVLYIDFFFNILLRSSYLYIYKYIEKRTLEFVFIVFFLRILKFLITFYKGITKEMIFDYFFMIVFFFVYIFIILELLFYFDFIFMIVLIIIFFLGFVNKNYNVSSR